MSPAYLDSVSLLNRSTAVASVKSTHERCALCDSMLAGHGRGVGVSIPGSAPEKPAAPKTVQAGRAAGVEIMSGPRGTAAAQTDDRQAMYGGGGRRRAAGGRLLLETPAV